MKLKKNVLDKAPVVLSAHYGNAITLWVQVLSTPLKLRRTGIRIDAKVNLCKGKAPKKKSAVANLCAKVLTKEEAKADRSAKKTEITSINKGSPYREPFLLYNLSFFEQAIYH